MRPRSCCSAAAQHSGGGLPGDSLWILAKAAASKRLWRRHAPHGRSQLGALAFSLPSAAAALLPSAAVG